MLPNVPPPSPFNIPLRTFTNSLIVYRFEAYLPGSVRSWVRNKLADFRQMLVENGLLAAKSDDGIPESRGRLFPFPSFVLLSIISDPYLH